MSGIENYRFNLANVWNTMRAHQWLDGFGHVSARDQIFSVLLNQWEAQPTSRAIDHCLPAAAYKFQGVLEGIELTFLTCSGDAGGQSIKPGNIIDAQVIDNISRFYGLPAGVAAAGEKSQ